MRCADDATAELLRGVTDDAVLFRVVDEVELPRFTGRVFEKCPPFWGATGLFIGFELMLFF